MTYRIRCEKCVYSEAFMDIEADSLDDALELAESRKDYVSFVDYDQTYNCHNVS